MAIATKKQLFALTLKLAVGLAQKLLRALWFALIPALLAGVTFRYLVSATIEPGASGIGNGLAHLRIEYPVPLAVGLFLCFAGLAHYWRFMLPGGGFLAALPALETARFSRNQLDEVSRAVELGRLLRTTRVRRSIERKLSPSELQELDASLTELHAAIEAGEIDRAHDTRRSASRLAAPVLRARNFWRGAWLALAVGVAVYAAVYLRTSVFQSYRVLSGSMLPTLQPGDHVAANKFVYGARLPWSSHARSPRMPRRGDVVVFQRMLPGSVAPEPLVKRVIGLPGDRIMMYAGYPFINGWKVPSCYAGPYYYLSSDGKSVAGRLSVEYLEDKTYLTVHTPTHRQVEAYEVKADEVFVLGDNRNESLDSRTWNHNFGGGVSASAIIGRVDRLVAHSSRDGSLQLGAVLQPLAALNLNLDNLETNALRAGIDTCLANRPKETEPPPESTPLPGDLARH